MGRWNWDFRRGLKEGGKGRKESQGGLGESGSDFKGGEEGLLPSSHTEQKPSGVCLGGFCAVVAKKSRLCSRLGT